MHSTGECKKTPLKNVMYTYIFDWIHMRTTPVYTTRLFEWTLTVFYLNVHT